MNLYKSFSISVMLVIVCAIRATVAEFHIKYDAHPTKIEIQVRYDRYWIQNVINGRKHYNVSPQQSNVWIYDLTPCTQYELGITYYSYQYKYLDYQNVTVTSLIELISPKVVNLEQHLGSIKVQLDYVHIECLHNLTISLNNTMVYQFTKYNATKQFTLHQLLPCVNYELEILINYQTGQYVVHNHRYIKIRPAELQSIHTIIYNNKTDLLTWSPVLLEDCTSKYVVRIQDKIYNTITLHLPSNGYKLDELRRCSKFQIVIYPHGHEEQAGIVGIQTGFKDPSPVTMLSVYRSNETAISIKWNYPVENPECVTNYLIKINNEKWISTQQLEYTVHDNKLCVIYKIVVCASLKPESCANYTFDSFQYDVKYLKNSTEPTVDVDSNSITTIIWYRSSRDEQCIKNYEVTLYDDDKQITHHRTVTNASIQFSDLVLCQTYHLRIQPVLIRTTIQNKMAGTYVQVKTKPQKPERPQLISATSNSLKMSSKYLSQNGECQIEKFQFLCNSAEYGAHSSSPDANGYGIITNLKNSTAYKCNAIVKNEMGWSKPSDTNLFYTNDWEEHEIKSKPLKVRRDEVSVIGYSSEKTPDQKLLTLPNWGILTVIDGANAKMTINENIIPLSDNHKTVTLTLHILELNCSDECAQDCYFEKLPKSVQITLKKDIARICKPTYDNRIQLKSGMEYEIKATFSTLTTCNANPIIFKTLPPIMDVHDNYSPIIYIVVILLFISLIAFNVLVMVWYYKPQIQQVGPFQSTQTYIQIEYFVDFYNLIDHNFIATEYQSIDNMDLSQLTKIGSQNHPTKNRYTDIAPYDHNRVILAPNEYCTTDYINASYIDGYKQPNRYIATQGPTEETAYDFWHMVIVNNCNKIVMLTQLQENNVTKCFKYFPYNNETLAFNDLSIINAGETSFGNFMQRVLVLTKYGARKHFLIHYQYLVWPDRDCPAEPLELIEFIEFTKCTNNKTTYPVIVHCSAGVGRSGTFIALDLLFREIQNEKYLSICETVQNLRRQRCRMVQTVGQYEFLYVSVLTFIRSDVFRRKIFDCQFESL